MHMSLMLLVNQVMGLSFHPHKVTQRAIQLSYTVEIASHSRFLKTEATTALTKLRGAGVLEFHITFAIEPKLTATQN